MVHYFFIYSLVFLSGATGLVYEVLWHKYLNMYMGGHAFATAIILSSFFLYLSLGYLFIGKMLRKQKLNPLKIYGYLELAIGLIALSSPIYFQYLYKKWPIYQSGSLMDVMSCLAFAACFMGPSCFLMGGTIPSLVEALSKDSKTAPIQHANIYSVNTLGAFFGVLFAGFYLVEAFGLELSFMLSGIVNILIYFVIFFMKFFSSSSDKLSDESHAMNLQNQKIENYSELNKTEYVLPFLISLLAGFYVFTLQNIFIRIASVTLGSSTYTFSLIVSVFIVGIAVGGKLSSNLQKRFAEYFFVFQYFILFVLLSLSYLLVFKWPSIFYFTRIIFNSHPFALKFYWFSIFILLNLMLFLPMLFIGSNLPSLFSNLKNRSDLGKQVGSLYFFNSLGSFFGALVGGYYLLNFFLEYQLFKMVLCLVLICFMFSSFYVNFKIKQAAALSLVGLICIVSLPKWTEKLFVPGSFLYTNVSKDPMVYNNLLDDNKSKTKILFSKHDPNTIVHVTQFGDKEKNLQLYVNGKPDASVLGDFRIRAYNALLPKILKPDAENVFVIGLGAGLSSSIFSASSKVKTVDVAEISKGVIESLDYFKEWNYDINKEKIKIFHNDALKILREQNKYYDIIVCEPSNPWVPGVENLYSVEHLTLAASKLTKNGVYAQWFPVQAITESVFKKILMSFQTVFKNVNVWSLKGGALLLLASNEQPILKTEEILSEYNNYAKRWKEISLDSFEQVLATQVLSSFSVKSILSTETEYQSMLKPILNYIAGRAHFYSGSIDWAVFMRNHMNNRAQTIEEKEDNQFIYERLDNLDKNKFLEQALKYSHSSSFPFILARYSILFNVNNKVTNLDEISIKKIQFYSAFLGNKNKIEYYSTFYSDFLNSLDKLLASQINFNISDVFNVLPANCGANSECFKTKKTALGQLRLGTLNLLTQKNIMPIDIEREWNQYAKYGEN